MSTEHIIALADLPEADHPRAEYLARAFRGRWVPAHQGYAMSPSYHARWQRLFDAGFSAAYRNGRWKFHPANDPARLLERDMVMRAV